MAGNSRLMMAGALGGVLGANALLLPIALKEFISTNSTPNWQRYGWIVLVSAVLGAFFLQFIFRRSKH